MTGIIRSDTCPNCKFSIRAGPEDAFFCRRNPPVVSTVIGYREEMEKGKRVWTPFAAGNAQAFPRVEADWFCGEWKPKIVMAQLQGKASGAA